MNVNYKCVQYITLAEYDKFHNKNFGPPSSKQKLFTHTKALYGTGNFKL